MTRFVMPRHARKSGRRGVTLLSYGLLVGLIGVVAIVTITSVGNSTDSLFTQVSDRLGGVASASGGAGAESLSVSGVSPGSGLPNTATTVTVSGNGFASGATVSFGGVPGTSVSVTSATQITVTTPDSVGASTVDVVVTVGSDSATLTNGFSFASPAGTGFCANSPPADNEIGCDPGDGTLFAGRRFTNQADRNDDGTASGARIYAAPTALGSMFWTSNQNNNDSNPAPCINGSADCFAPDEATILGDGIGNPAFEACYCLGETAADGNSGNNPGVCSGQPGSVLNGGQGHNDWYLPSNAELDQVYVGLVVGSGTDSDNPLSQYGANGGNSSPSGADGPFASALSGFYWSSSERRRNDDAWTTNMDTGQTYFSNGNTNGGVLCIRQD
ncbi:MAG: hypothetical protein Alpg2KO_14560 [Alphaproteobacteria bacterium]